MLPKNLRLQKKLNLDKADCETIHLLQTVPARFALYRPTLPNEFSSATCHGKVEKPLHATQFKIST